VIDCNWKTFLEVFSEWYHLPFVHRDSINDVYKPPEPVDVVTGEYTSQFGGTEGTGSQLQGTKTAPMPMMPGLTGREAAGARYTWVFPNMAFAACVDALWIYEAYPMGGNQCLVFQTTTFPPETVKRPEFEAELAAFYHRLDTALAEDIPALMNQQRGLASPDACPGRFQSRLEPNIAAFAKWYASKISS
jgi:phenylpropionate dioxygenase-like ring-hydroxylating dioxygenase large terminal subunit